MGHERIGVLPRTKHWQDIVNAMAMPVISRDDTRRIAAQTLNNVSKRYSKLMLDDGVKAAFRFIIILSISSRSRDPYETLREKGIELSDKPTPIALTKAVHDFVRKNQESPEYARIAQYAAGDAIVNWHRLQSPPQSTLFDILPGPFDIWKKSNSGAGFCELSRLYFAKITERYLNYFLEREATAVIRDVKMRDDFMENLNEFMEEISHHAFETSRITQSFAAGWYNKHVHDDLPNDEKITRFLRLAFEKIREELNREADNADASL